MNRLARREMLALLAALPAAAKAGPSGTKVTESIVIQGGGRIAVPGGHVRWAHVGKGPKTPLLLLHGGPGAGSDYLFPMAALAKDRDVIFYDQLGCGRSDAPDKPELYRIPRFLDELDAVRKALGLERVILFGNSWGGMLAIEYLVDGRGHGIEKLILSGGLASIPQAVAGEQRLIDALPGGAGARIHALEKAGKTGTPEYDKLTNLFYSLHLCRLKAPPPEYAKAIDNLSKSPAYRVMNGPNEFTITGNIKDWDRRSALSRIRVPTLVMTGEFDEVTRDCQETIRDGIAGSKLVVLEGCSHLTMLEAPERHNGIIESFIS
jgi:proline iminopeptidase